MKTWLRCVTLVTLLGLPLPSPARQVQVPLQFDAEFLRQALVAQAYTDAKETARVWGDGGGCNFLTLSNPRVDTHAGRLRVMTSAKARAGTALGSRCLLVLDWEGDIEVFQEPTIAPKGPTLAFSVTNSNLYEKNGQKRVATGILWDWVKQYVHPRLSALAIDLHAPLTELQRLLTQVLPSHGQPTDQNRVQLVGVGTNDRGVSVTLGLEVPYVQPAPASAGPEPALPPEELARLEAALQRWDAFLTYALKQAAGDIPAEEFRLALLEILLEARQDLVAALSAPTPAHKDPVHELFLRTWQRLAPVLRRLSAELPNAAALRYLTFITAADALQAVEQLGAGTGLEISADGLRRLARILAPQEREDPLVYRLDVDPKLRDLFGFGPPLPAPRIKLNLNLRDWLFRPAWAAGGLDSARLERLDGWVPSREELREYLHIVRDLLKHTADEGLRSGRVPEQFHGLYRPLVLATAWQESCWRQFVKKGGRIQPLQSSVGAVGIMQINQKVWRGFYDVKGLQSDIAYNAKAGGEILIHYLVDYAIKKGEHKKTGNVQNLARATYAVYNGGPAHLRRYRQSKTGKSLRMIDQSFWEKYQTIKKGNELAVARCFGTVLPKDTQHPTRTAAAQPTNEQRQTDKTARAAQAVPSAKAPKPPRRDTVKQEPWLLRQDPQHYTLQLVATRQREKVPTFVRNHGLSGDVAYYRFLRKDQAWYGVVYGTFADRSGAERALAALPKKLKAASPWIRKFSAIQDDIGGAKTE